MATKQSSGAYTWIGTDNREWTIVRNDEIKDAPWQVYSGDSATATVLDPYRTKREAIEGLEEMDAMYCRERGLMPRRWR